MSPYLGNSTGLSSNTRCLPNRQSLDCARSEGLPAPDEVDDLELIACFYWGSRPPVAGDDFTIQLDRYTVSLHAELFYQACQCLCRDIARFAVDSQDHENIVAVRVPGGKSPSTTPLIASCSGILASFPAAAGTYGLPCARRTPLARALRNRAMIFRRPGRSFPRYPSHR